MNQEIIGIVAVYLLLASAIWLAILVGWLTAKARKFVKRLDNILAYEEEFKKYRDN